MKRLAIFATQVMLAVSLAAQAPAPALTAFAGTYKAEFHKHIWLTLTLIDSGSGLNGTLTHAVQLSADDEGDITSVGDDMTTDAVAKAELRGDSLQITTKDEEGNEDTYKLVLTGTDAAELTPVTADGASPTKPYKLKRTTSESDKKAVP